MENYVVALAKCTMADVAGVGAKNASLGEMIGQLSGAGIKVPEGFTTTSVAFRDFLAQDGLEDTIKGLLHDLDVSDVEALSRRAGEIRNAMMSAALPAALQKAVSSAWHSLSGDRDVACALRASVAVEGMHEASFAGQQQTLLNVTGLGAVLSGIHEIYASIYTDRAIAYRVHQGIAHRGVAMSVAVQRMVRSETSSAGVMFTLDTETGFRNVVLITSSYGLGESIVQGTVNPDEFYVFKPTLKAGKKAIVRRNLGEKSSKLVCAHASRRHVQLEEVSRADRQRFSLTDEDVLALARQAVKIEEHYGRPMDIEWARDGTDGELYIVQAVPETVQSRHPQGTVHFALKKRGRTLTRGRGIGQRVGVGRARLIADVKEMHLIEKGDVLVTDMTGPDWEPVMKRAAAIVTDRGGRTSHAAIVARELGIPAVVGCGDATASILDGTDVTVSCAEGDEGFVYEGRLDYDLQEFRIGMLPKIPVNLMMNVGNPARAFSFAATPNFGVGLARLEFIINRLIGVHPLALLEYERQPMDVRAMIDVQMAGYPDPVSFFVEKLAEGIACIAAAVAPHPAIVRLSDFKSNEYASLIGGRRYEPLEPNPALGFRGAARYLDPEFSRCFELECRALKLVREGMGLSNVQVMVPYVRSLEEAGRVIAQLKENGLARGVNGLKILMMCETPNNALLAEQFLVHFDGMSIGSNDMTQLTLGVHRDSDRVAGLFDERAPAMQQLFGMVIDACKHNGKSVSICGQGPADHPELARWLAERGIESISLDPDSVLPTWLYLAGDKSA